MKTTSFFRPALFVGALAITLAGLVPGQARASATDLDEVVYAPYIADGETSLEIRSGKPLGSAGRGVYGGILELEHGFSDRWSGALIAGYEREPGSHPKIKSLGVEGVLALGTFDPLDIDAALYGELAKDIEGKGATAEAKLLLAKRVGPSETRFNLIVEQGLGPGGGRAEYSYAAHSTIRLSPRTWIGVEGFGGLGEWGSLGGRQPIYAGPMIRFGFPTRLVGVKVEAAWLTAFGAARQSDKGQARLMVEFERRW